MELDEDLGVAEGQEVEVQVRMIGPKKRLPAPRMAAGATQITAGMMANPGPKRMTALSRR